MNKKIAVVLCGSGFKDGSEIRESVGALLALDQHHAEAFCFAPDDFQHDVVNCLTGEIDSLQERNMLVESARIARGKVKPLHVLDPEKFDGIIIPGGFGAAKNLCTFGLRGIQGEVRSDLEKILKKFHALNKPIGAICIAPAILALTFRSTSLQLTVGESSSTSEALEKLGHKHIPCESASAVWDSKNKVASTPAYMNDEATLSDIFKGIDKLVQYVLGLI